MINFKKFGIVTLCSGLAAGTVILAGCGSSAGNETSETTAASTQTADTTESSASETTQAATSSTATDSSSSETEEKQVSVEVTDKDGNTVSYTESTNAEYLRGVLDELTEDSDFTYSGSDTGYGLFIDHVNGERADYTLDGAYWSIYVNDEYAQNGVDTQEVSDGDTFALKYEKAN